MIPRRSLVVLMSHLLFCKMFCFEKCPAFDISWVWKNTLEANIWVKLMAAILRWIVEKVSTQIEKLSTFWEDNYTKTSLLADGLLRGASSSGLTPLPHAKPHALLEEQRLVCNAACLVPSITCSWAGRHSVSSHPQHLTHHSDGANMVTRLLGSGSLQITNTFTDLNNCKMFNFKY